MRITQQSMPLSGHPCQQTELQHARDFSHTCPAYEKNSFGWPQNMPALQKHSRACCTLRKGVREMLPVGSNTPACHTRSDSREARCSAARAISLCYGPCAAQMSRNLDS